MGICCPFSSKNKNLEKNEQGIQSQLNLKATGRIAKIRHLLKIKLDPKY